MNKDLQKVVRKAAEKGWVIPSKGYAPLIINVTDITEETWKGIFFMLEEECRFQKWYLTHAFAKAYWGEEDMLQVMYSSGEYDDPYPVWMTQEEWKQLQASDERYDEEQVVDETPSWKFHLSVLVIQEDPITYLVEHL